MKIRDKIFLWGQNAGAHHSRSYGLPGVNRMESDEGCQFFGIKNCCRVAMESGPYPPFDSESEKLKHLSQVVWAATGDSKWSRHDNDQSDLDEILRQAEKYSNITGAVLDDFFPGKQNASDDRVTARHTLGSIQSMSERLHNFPKRRLDLWVVWYDYQLDLEVDDYLSLCDVMTLWTWCGSQIAKVDANIDKMIARSLGKRHLAGCYMWNYGEHKPLTNQEMQDQLDCYFRRIKKGDIEGIVLCSNCIADIGLEAVEITQRWLNTVGEEEI